MKILGAPLGTFADDKRQGQETWRTAVSSTVPSAAIKLAQVFLPQRKPASALLDLDPRAIRIKLEDSGIGNPRIHHEARARAGGVEKQQRGVVGDSGKDQNFVAPELALTGKRDF